MKRADNVITEAEIQVIHPQIKERWQPPESSSKEGFSPSPLEQTYSVYRHIDFGPVQLILDLRLPEL